MGLVRRLLGCYRAHQRAIDIKILWPICVQRAPTLDHAKAIFAFHAVHDPAWRALGEDELFKQIDALTGEA